MEEKVISMRLNKEYYDIIKAAADATNTGVSTFMREVAYNYAKAGGKNPESVDVKKEPVPQIESEFIEYWAKLVPMLDEEMFLENIMKINGIGPDIENIHRVWKYILDRVNGVSHETSTEQEVSQGNNPYAGWIYDGQLATDEGLVYWAKKVLPGGKEFKKDFLSGTPGSEMFDGLNPGDVIK